MSSKRLGPVPLLDVLASSIKDDPVIRAAASSVDQALAPIVQAIPRMLIWARLWGDTNQLSPSLRRIVEHCGGLPPLTDAELELLAWQMHVDFWDPSWSRETRENLVKYATSWHRLKGTPAGVKLALSLFGVKAEVDENGRGRNWAVYELELAEIPRGNMLTTIVEVATETAPQRCRLRRVYGGYNGRPMRNDQAPKLDSAIYDDDSGVWDPETGIKQSFGERKGLQADTGSLFSAWLAAEYVHCLKARYVRGFIHDQHRWDSVTIKRHGIVGGAVVTLMSGGLGAEKCRWEGPWDHRSWMGMQAPLTQSIPRRRIDTHYSISKAQIVWDYTRHDSGLQKYGPSYALRITRTPRLDGNRFDGSRTSMGVRTERIDEFFRETRFLNAAFPHSVPALLPSYVRAGMAQREKTLSGVSVTTFKEEITGLLSIRRPYSLPDGTEWSGPWTHRTWNSMGVPVNSTTEGE